MAEESVSRNEGPACRFSGCRNSIEHIQRDVRSKFLHLPGAVLRNFIFLSEYIEITFLKVGGNISWVNRELSEEFRTLWNLGSIHAFIQQTFIEDLLYARYLISFH